MWKRTLVNILGLLFLLLTAILGSCAATKPIAPIKEGLPGGGHHCCYRPGFVTFPACGSVPITPTNIFSFCASCVPVQLWC